MRPGSSMEEIQGASTSERTDTRGWRRRTRRNIAAAALLVYGSTFLWMTASFAGTSRPPGGAAWVMASAGALVSLALFTLAAGGCSGRGGGGSGPRRRARSRPGDAGAVLDRRFLDPRTRAQQAHPHRGQRSGPALVACSGPRTPPDGVALGSGPALEAVARRGPASRWAGPTASAIPLVPSDHDDPGVPHAPGRDYPRTRGYKHCWQCVHPATVKCHTRHVAGTGRLLCHAPWPVSFPLSPRLAASLGGLLAGHSRPRALSGRPRSEPGSGVAV